MNIVTTLLTLIPMLLGNLKDMAKDNVITLKEILELIREIVKKTDLDSKEIFVVSGETAEVAGKIIKIMTVTLSDGKLTIKETLLILYSSLLAMDYDSKTVKNVYNIACSILEALNWSDGVLMNLSETYSKAAIACSEMFAESIANKEITLLELFDSIFELVKVFKLENVKLIKI